MEFIAFASVFLCLLQLSTQQNNGYRLCVPESDDAECEKMVTDLGQGGKLKCVSVRDRIDCLQKIQSGDVDMGVFDPEDIYIAAQNMNDNFVIVTELRSTKNKEDAFRYKGVAVVKKSANIKSLSDLRGKGSCHTGYGRNAGWNIPISQLIHLRAVPLECDAKRSSRENELYSVSQFFGRACVVGTWTPDIDTDRLLKQKYPKLCELCDDPSACAKGDKFSDYEGALKCLTDGEGDVAWTKQSAVENYFGLVEGSQSHAVAADFSYLCPDGKSQPVIAKNPCSWAGRPWKAILAKKSVPKTTLMDMQSEIAAAVRKAESLMSRPSWFQKVFGFTDDTGIEFNPVETLTSSQYLAKGNFTTVIGNNPCDLTTKAVRFCTRTPVENAKCRELKLAAFSRYVRPELDCVQESSVGGCMTAIKNDKADIIALDGAEVFKGGDTHGLKPVLSEHYGSEDTLYYAVAVIKAKAPFKLLSDLKGKKSCHTGFGRTAGWKIPVFALKKHKLLDPVCPYAKAVGQFFSKSCVPGAKLPDNDPDKLNPDNLCSLCVGEEVNVHRGPENAKGPTYDAGQSKCAAESKEAFYGYSGAFRCLVEGGGDVAFVKHTTVLENTDGAKNASWTQGLRSEDFKLLCPEGGTTSVRNYASCNLGRVPSHKVVTAGTKSPNEMEEIRLVLLKLSEVFSKNPQVFRLFGSYNGAADLLFKDSATKLVNLIEGSSFQSVEESYVKMLEDVKECIGSGSRASFQTFVTLLLVSVTAYGVSLF